MKATLVVHVVPRARRTGVSGPHGDAIKITLAAPPVGGAANAELVRFVARRLRLAPGAVTITGGAAGRRKILAVVGLDSATARRTLLAGAR